MVQKVKKPSISNIVVMSKMDFEIAVRVYLRYMELGFTDEEVSFLMGKRNKYVFDLMDPTQKDKFKTQQLDILPTILACKIRSLIPNDVLPNETVKLRAFKKRSVSKLVYEYVVVDHNGLESEVYSIRKNVRPGGRKHVNDQVYALILAMISEGYFGVLRNGLELFLEFKSRLKVNFKVADLQKSLAICLRSDSRPALLKREIVDSRFFYQAV